MLTFLLFATCAIAGNVPTAEVDDFLDSVLRQATAAPREQPRDYQLDGPLGATLALADVESLGPTRLERLGSADGTQSTHDARTSAAISLGQLDYGVGATAQLFGFEFSAYTRFTLKDARSQLYLFVDTDRGFCHVHVRVEPPTGEYLVRFEPQMDLPPWLTATVEYLLPFALQYVPSQFINQRGLFSDVTRHLERELTKVTRELSCRNKDISS